MKVNLELIIHDLIFDRIFLNYFDGINGNDVYCQIIDGKLFKFEYNESGDELPNHEISLIEFIKLVKSAVLKQ